MNSMNIVLIFASAWGIPFRHERTANGLIR